jgi:hypothetical protein
MIKTISAQQVYDGFAYASIEKENSFDINHLQRAFDHCSLESLNSTVKMYGLTYLGDFETCEELVAAKAQNKNVIKIGQAQEMYHVNDSALISAPLRKVSLEEPYSGPSLLIIALTTSGVL